jgi:predicted  nucleic acid-binding Zn-ribbon protein
MSYEYLKGMGAAGVSNQGNQGISDRGRQSPPPSSNPPPGGGAGQFGRTQQNAGMSNQGNAGMTNRGATPARTAAPTGFVFQAYVIEPAVPAGSVKTLPDERVELKQYCRNRFGATNVFNVDKARLDPSFTYMKAETLAEYRNARYVVRDMMAAPPDAAVTVADIAAFKAWWRRCHPSTYTLFEIRKSNATWVPQALSLSYKRTFKAAGNCPAGATKTSMFEYKVGNTAAELLTQERERQRVETLNRSTAVASRAEEEARVAREALTVAQNQLRDLQTQLDKSRGDLTTARNEATMWRTAAEEATKKATDLQTAIDGLGQNITALTNQLAATTSPEAAAILQAQIADLTGQLSTAQTLQADAIAQAQAAQAAAAQTEANAAQAEVVVAQTQVAVETTVAQVSELEPWYIKYKWYLVGAAVLAGGAYWYMNKQKAAAAPALVPALTKNWLPEPTSPRRPSGLNRNRRHGR